MSEVVKGLIKKSENKKTVKYHYIDEENSVDVLSKKEYNNEDKIELYPHYPSNGKKKYKHIKKIICIGFHRDISNIIGINKAENKGWGFTQELKEFGYYLDNQLEIEEVIIEKGGKITYVEKEKRLYLNEEVLTEIRDKIKPVKKENKQRLNHCIVELLHKLDPEHCAAPKKKYIKDSLYYALSEWSQSLEEFSEKDKKELKNLFQKLSITGSFLDIQDIEKTKVIIDSCYVKKSLEEFQKLMNNDKTAEKKWQKFLSDNNWIFSYILALPIFLFKKELYVGGKSIDNKNGKFADFAVKNKKTSNISLIEIKTPSTPLIEKKPYRGNDVFAISKDLSGCINQILDQRDNLQKYYYSLVAEKEKFKVYNTKCIIIIGKIDLLDENQIKSFELFRSNSKDIETITFDELLSKIEIFDKILSA